VSDARRRPRTTVAGVHADWLRLVEPNGPFLTLPVLRRVWPNGLDHLDADGRAEVRRRLADLHPDDPATVTAWVEWVLADLLAYGSRLRSGPQVPATLVHVVAEHGAVLRPDHVLDDGTGGARLLVTAHPPGTRLDARPAGDRWSATPVERLAILCRATGVEVGLATNATTWTMVWAPKDGASGTATFSAELFSEEPALLDAFTSVLGARRFFAVAGPDRLEALLAESASAQAEVTGTLGRQVRQAVELLVAAMSRADRDRDGALLAGIDAHQVYEGAVAVLMRLVLLLYSEERGLLPLGDDLYDRTLAASTLLDQLRATQADTGDEPLERSNTAWHRLLALFRAVHAGISHDRLRIPAYGSSLFDPDRFAFLEGRQPGGLWHGTAAEPIPVDDLTVLAMLSALQELRFAEGGVTETRRLTYRALDVEQVGHVYEGLLDHSAVAAERTAVGLVGKAGSEPEVDLDDVAGHAARGRDAFVAWLVETTGLSARRIERVLDTVPDADSTRLLRAACDNDEALTARLLPYARLLRPNLRGLPTVFPAGSMYVTQTGAKRDSGTAYTTKELADEVVEHALAPLVYSPGPAEGAEPADWKLRPSSELLALKVCDPAVGSGAILVAACRYLAARLVEAWTAEGAPEVEGDATEVVIAARRAVADRCLYGVDRDPMAVEMAKLSLWLVTLSKERPFSFLDHALKSGDSLLGITDLDQLRALHLDPVIGRAKVGLSLKPDAVDEAVAHAVGLRRRLESIPVVTVADAEEKTRLNAEADSGLAALRTVADLVVGCALRAELHGQPPLADQIAASAPMVAASLDPDQPAELRNMALGQLATRALQALDASRPAAAPTRSPLHWPLAFPEVFVDGDRGFDAIVGNPPFLGGSRISAPLGNDYRDFICRYIAGARTSRADLVIFFLRRSEQLVGLGGTVGLIATKTVAEADSRQAGLDILVQRGWMIYRAIRSRYWPGLSNVVIAQVWMRRGAWDGPSVLNGTTVGAISPSLEVPSRSGGEPRQLIENRSLCFLGSLTTGMGFILDREEASALLESHPHYREVLKPYMTGSDVANSFDLVGRRWAIDFGDRSLAECGSRFPLLLDIVRERVKPDRDRLPDRRKRLRAFWWQYEHRAQQVYTYAVEHRSLLVLPRVSKYIGAARAPSDQIFSTKVVSILDESDATFGIVSSNWHVAWALRFGGRLKTDPVYDPGAVFGTYPRPSFTDRIADVAAKLEAHRTGIMLQRKEGLTATYNRVHDPSDASSDIATLRELHVALDNAVADAYGWLDLELVFGFHETRRGRRYSPAPVALQEMVERLQILNYERYDAEAPAELGDRRHRKGRSTRSDAPTLL
jgi:hypothetical protein